MSDVAGSASLHTAGALDEPNANLWRKKPVVVRARQWFGNGHCPVWAQNSVVEKNTYFDVVSLEGPMRGGAGYWIIEGVAGEIYCCEPDIFAATYEQVA